jgi:hypothetical protein
MCGGMQGGQGGYMPADNPYGGLRRNTGIVQPAFNPMTTNPNGGPPGHFLPQWRGQPQQQITPPQFAPHSFGPNMQPNTNLAQPFLDRRPPVYAGSTATGEPALPGQAVNLPQDQLTMPNFLFSKKFYGQ